MIMEFRKHEIKEKLRREEANLKEIIILVKIQKHKKILYFHILVANIQKTRKLHHQYSPWPTPIRSQ